jgi:hypothetical protein
MWTTFAGSLSLFGVNDKSLWIDAVAIEGNSFRSANE